MRKREGKLLVRGVGVVVEIIYAVRPRAAGQHPRHAQTITRQNNDLPGRRIKRERFPQGRKVSEITSVFVERGITDSGIDETT